MSTIIGITHSYEDNFAKLDIDYLKMLSKFGVISLIIPYTESIENILNITDGIILSGGGDLSEYLLKEKLSPKAKNIYPQRDKFESELCKKAYEQNKPLLGICRGIQVINTAFGGEIYQHIDNHLSKTPHTPIIHKIEIEKNSRLSKLCKTPSTNVNSYHHQSLSKVAKEFSICAKSNDNIIEAIESNKKKFFMGVQWHPEKMPNSNLTKNIFTEFINACKG